MSSRSQVAAQCSPLPRASRYLPSSKSTLKPSKLAVLRSPSLRTVVSPALTCSSRKKIPSTTPAFGVKRTVSSKSPAGGRSRRTTERRSSDTTPRRSVSSSRPSKTNPKAFRKSVSFSDAVSVKESDITLTSRDMRRVWYTQQEDRDMESAFNLVVMKLENGEKAKNETRRGLERQTSEGKWKRYENTRDAWNQVLGEQERQMRSNTKDADAIAFKYFSQTVNCRKEALVRGLKDTKSCRKYLGKK